MVQGRAAERYAKSLLEFAQEQKNLDKVNKDINLVYQTIEENRDLQLMLKSPIIKPESKNAVLDKIFSGKVEKLTISFFKLITSKGRANLTHAIAESFIEQFDEIRGIQKAVLTTTFQISDDLRKEVEALVKEVSGKAPDLTEKQDPEIMGGFILNFGDREIDASVKNKLKELEFELTR